MPPKATTKNSRRSKRARPEWIPIYEMLADKDLDNGVREVCRKIEALLRNDDAEVERTFFVFVLKVCGLSSLVDIISWREPLESLAGLLEEINGENQRSVEVGELFIINQKSKFHKQFLRRVDDFLEVSISDELNLMADTDVLKTMYQVLELLSKCKMRNVRHSAVVLSGILISKCALFYLELLKQKINKRASKLLGFVSDKLLQVLMKPRMKDIDSQIREKAFEVMGEALQSFEQQLLTAKKMEEVYIKLFGENKQKITEICLKSVSIFFEMEKQKMKTHSRRELIAFASEIIKPLQQLILIPNRSSCLAMDLLASIHTFNPSLNSLKPKLIAKVFEIHGYERFQDGLKKAVSLFLKSLINYNTKEELLEHRSVLTVEIVHMLTSINSTKLLSTILRQFFSAHQSLFSFDDMFMLMLTEYYNSDGSEVELHESELSIICVMICQFNQYLRAQKKSQEIEKQFLSYNKNVLSNCKEIFYDKISKHSAISHLYLRLFSLLVLPVSPSLHNYLVFVQEKVLNFVHQEQFVSMCGEKLTLMQMIIHECVAVCEMLMQQAPREHLLVKNFRLPEVLAKDKLDEIDIIKISQLSSKFNIPELIDESLFRHILSTYKKIPQKIIKLQCLTYCYHIHNYKFKSLFSSPTKQKHQQYIPLRNAFTEFLIDIILSSSQQQSIVKVAVFNVLARSLKFISNNKICELGQIYYQPSQQQVQVLFFFVGEYVRFGGEDVEEMTSMMGVLGLEGQEIRTQIITNLFMIFTNCFRLTLNKHSIAFLTNFMLTSSLTLKPYHKYLDNFLTEMVKQEIAPENGNKFVFWRIYHEVVGYLKLQEEAEEGNREGQGEEKEEEDKVSLVMTKMVDVYYRYRKSQAQIKSQLSNKLMLYIADSIDKCINTSNYRDLEKIRGLLGKVFRRFSKEILQRLLIFYNSKTSNSEDKELKSMQVFLTRISKVKKAKGIKSKQEEEDEDQDEEQEKENQKENEEEEENDKQEEEDKDEEEMKQNKRNSKISQDKPDNRRKSTRNKTIRKV